jgi:hypothetical protein
MPNIFFELDRLKVSLENKGLDSETVERIMQKASSEIGSAFSAHGEAALQQAIEAGVSKRSADFINDLKLDSINMQLTTQSGNLDFSEPPFPMLPKLLQGAKPIKDGSGVYKVIPVGAPSSNRPKIATNIYDAWKQVNTERLEAAKAQYDRVAPKGSKTQFRTATSKQNANTQWVMPAKNKDFSEDVSSINKGLEVSMEETIRDIIRNYEESF